MKEVRHPKPPIVDWIYRKMTRGGISIETERRVLVARVLEEGGLGGDG